MNPRRLFPGWYQVLISAWVLGVASTTIQFSVGFLVDPILSEFGWSMLAVTTAFSLRSQSSALAAPFVGMCIDRFGTRLTLVMGLLTFSASLFWLSQVDSIWSFYASFCLLSVGNSAIAGQVAGVNVARWFVRQRGRAMLLVYLGPGLASLTIPIYATFMGAYGWRAGQWMWGLVVIAFCVPVALMVRESPEAQGLLPDGVPVDKAGGSGGGGAESVRRQAAELRGPSMTTRQALRNGTFWRLATALTLTSLAAGPVLALMVPALTKGGVSREVATFTNSSFPLVLAVLRLIMARWGDTLERRNLMAACFACQTVATVAIAFTTQETVFLVAPFLLLYGIGFGIPVPLRSTLTADYFGVNSMGTIQGILQFLTTVGGVAGPLLVGWLVDVTGSYRWSFLVLAVAAFAAIPLMLTLPQIQPRPRVDPSPLS